MTEPVRQLTADEFIKEFKKAPEWRIYVNANTNGSATLRVRDLPLGPWTDYRSPDALKMTAEEWLEFVRTVEANRRGQERRNAT